jgi:hypothetical protein
VILWMLLLAQSDPDEVPPRIDLLIERLGDAEIGPREEGQRDITRFWRTWTDADLAALEKASASPKPELAARALAALKDIRYYRTFAVHLAARLDERGALSVDGRAGSPDDAFKPYAKVPVDPTGKCRFTGLRLFLEVDKNAPFRSLHTTLAAAARDTPLTEIILLDPSEEPDRHNLVIFTLKADPADQAADWKHQFIKEVGYHYTTQQFKNAEIEALQKKVAELETKLAERK